MAKIDMNAIYTQSEEVVMREIEGQIIIVPIGAGVADMEDELFTLNEVGRAIWKILEAHTNVQSLIDKLELEYEASHEKITSDVLGFLEALLERKMIVKV